VIVLVCVAQDASEGKGTVAPAQEHAAVGLTRHSTNRLARMSSAYLPVPVRSASDWVGNGLSFRRVSAQPPPPMAKASSGERADPNRE
jgi:hypothetical protein